MSKTTDMILILAMVFFVSSYLAPARNIQTQLYFGLSLPNGMIISDSAWNVFVRDDISKVFSAGFTVIHSDGNWVDMEQKKLHAEPSCIVTSVSTMTSSLSARIDSLREKYKTRFQQESVLRIDEQSCVSF